MPATSSVTLTESIWKQSFQTWIMQRFTWGVVILGWALGNFVAAASPEESQPASPSRPVVVLEVPEEGKHTNHDRLVREVLRQAFLVAVRDEFRLSTRDPMLRENVDVPEASRRTFRLQVEVPQYALVKVKLEAMPADGTIAPWTSEFLAGDEKQLESTLTFADQWSRGAFVDWLKSAKLPQAPAPAGKPELNRSAPVPLDFVSQVMVLRKLHAALLHDPQSPELLSKVAEHYALLGSLTELHWGSEHKIFKARALLYAARAAHVAPQDAGVAWSRALAQALSGRDDLAVKEIARAQPLSTPQTTPPWAEGLTAYVNWNDVALAACVEKKQPLAAYLRMHAMELAGSEEQRIRAVKDVMKTSPECLRAVAVMASEHVLGLRRSLGPAQFQQFLISFPTQVKQIPNLPKGVREAVEEVIKTDSAPEAVTSTVQLVRSLHHVPANLDPQEPSLSTLSTLASNLHWIHALRLLELEQWDLAVDASDTRKVMEELLQDHPAREFLQVFQIDTIKAQKAYSSVAPALQKLPVSEASWQLIHWLEWLNSGQQGSLENMIRNQRDYVVPDLLARLRDNRSPGEVKGALMVLGKVSPHCPGLQVETIKHDWEKAQSQAEIWENESPSPPVLNALAEHYSAAVYEHPDHQTAAERCWKKLIDLEPSYDSYGGLSRLYQMTDQEDLWEETMIKSLKLPSFGLEDTRVHIELANWYMDRQQWERAKPHALEAAGSYAGGGLMCAARYLEGLGEWKEAEKLVRSNTERYDMFWLDWYLWCRRTGHGDLEAARAHCKQVIDGLPEANRKHDEEFAIYQYLEGNPEEAVVSFQHFAADEESGRFWTMMSIIVLGELGRSEERDRIIKDLASRKASSPTTVLCEQLVRPADSLLPPLNDEELQFDFEFSSVQGAGAGESTNMAYFLGMMLLQRGQKEQAIDWLQRAASSPLTRKSTCVFATAELNRLGVTVQPRRTSELDPKLVEAQKLVEKGILHRDHQRLELAAHKLDAALMKVPNWTVALFHRAEVHILANEFPQANQCYTRILEQIPHQPLILCIRANTRAIQDYEEAVKVSPAYQRAVSGLKELRQTSSDDGKKP